MNSGALVLNGARNETRDMTEEIRLRIDHLFMERVNDLRILARLWQEREPDKRLPAFIRDAEIVLQNEPSYNLINFVDKESIIRASAPPDRRPELTGLDLKSLPGREAMHRRVRESGGPLISPPMVLSGGERGMVIWYPVFEGEAGGAVYAGAVGGIFVIETLPARITSESSLRQFDIRILVAGESIFNSVDSEAEAEILNFVNLAAAREVFSVLGQEWDVTVKVHAAGKTAAGFNANRVRFLLQFLLAFMGAALLYAAIFALDRSWKTRGRLAESERRLEMALQGASMGLWDWDLRSGSVSYDRRWAEMLGYSIEEITPSIETWKGLLHPDDAAGVLSDLDRCIRSTDGFYETEHRLRSKSGEWVWVLDKGKIMERDAAGRPLRMVGTHLDITRLKETLVEKDMLLKEVHHRVKNNLQIIISLLNLQKDGVKDPDAAGAIQESRDRVMAMSLIHEKLYQNDSAGRISAGDYLRDLSERVFYAYNTGNRVSFSISVQDLKLDIDTAIPLGLILNELITNSIKYAFPDGRTGSLRVSLSAGKEGVCRLEVADDGVGLPDGFDIRTAGSLGFRLVLSLADQLKGKVIINNEKSGLKAAVEFRKG